MFSKLALLAIFGTTVVAQTSQNYAWIAPSSTDRRSPCPMVNTLANHGYLPRNGLNISMDDLIVAFNASLNLASDATELVGGLALTNTSTGDPLTFNLDDLDQHHVLEHDGSLSRNDYYFGDDHTFNATIWDSVAVYFTEDTISLQASATARLARFAAAAAVNPAFNLTDDDFTHSLIEQALYQSAFGNITTGDAVTEWVGIMFTKERLAYEEGFTRPSEQITIASVTALVDAIAVLS